MIAIDPAWRTHAERHAEFITVEPSTVSFINGWLSINHEPGAARITGRQHLLAGPRLSDESRVDRDTAPTEECQVRPPATEPHQQFRAALDDRRTPIPQGAPARHRSGAAVGHVHHGCHVCVNPPIRRHCTTMRGNSTPSTSFSGRPPGARKPLLLSGYLASVNLNSDKASVP